MVEKTWFRGPRTKNKGTCVNTENERLADSRIGGKKTNRFCKELWPGFFFAGGRIHGKSGSKNVFRDEPSKGFRDCSKVFILPKMAPTFSARWAPENQGKFAWDLK